VGGRRAAAAFLVRSEAGARGLGPLRSVSQRCRLGLGERAPGSSAPLARSLRRPSTCSGWSGTTARTTRWDQAPIADSDRREDRTFQNHMCNHPGEAGPVPTALAAACSASSVSPHRLYFNRGELGGIPTIHFARWVITPDGRQVLFFSNFDGSWERYLGDFIEQARRGLNAIWSNTLGYPKTFGLVEGGAEDEERFKSFARNSMHRTRVWYAADPDLSIQNIRDNARIREEAFASSPRRGRRVAPAALSRAETP
jgi:hypothetical protein